MANILLVDDDVDLVEVNQTVLEQRGHHVAVAYSAQEAERVLEHHRPDIAVIDVIMESRTAGLELVRKLDRVAPHVPAVLVSGMQAAGSYRFVLNETWEPVVAYLDKPVDPEQLASRIEKLLSN